MRSEPGLRRKNFSAQLKIGLAFALLGAGMFAAVGLLSGLHARQQLERSTGEALFELARNVSLNLDMGLFERFREISNLASLESRSPRERDDAGWFQVVETLQSSLPEYSWIGVTDAQGRVVAATDGLLQGQSVSQRPWFQQGLRSPYVGELHEAKLLSRLLPPTAGGEPYRFLDFSAPILREGRTVGVIGAHLTWRWAQARCQAAVSPHSQQAGIEIAVFDAQGVEILHPRNGAPPTIRTRAQLDEWVTHRWGVRQEPDGQRFLVASVRSTGYEGYQGLGWTVIVRQPLALATAAALGLQYRIWAAGTGGALLFGVLGWLLAGRLTAPLRSVAHRATEVAARSGISAAGLQAHDEVEQVAASLGSLVSQLQAREAELRRANEDLESRVQERTASLSRANADLESFSRSISHDLKGPLAAMGAMLRRLIDTKDGLSSRQTLILDALAQECNRLLELVDGMLSLAMVDRRPLQRQAVDMAELARATVDNLGIPATAHASEETAWRRSIGPMPSPIEADPVLLRQVWQNLISNAVKFTSKTARPCIEIGGERRGDEAVYWVRDNGPGFDPSRAASLFEAFERLPEAADFPGTGVGLSIVWKVMHRHGGRVWCEATPGQGARFYFALPVASLPPPSPSPDPADAAHSADLPLHG